MKGKLRMVKESNENYEHEEPPLEDFFIEEEIDEKDIRRKRRRRVLFQLSAAFLALVFLINGLAIWTSVINIPALKFVKTSYRLSQNESIQTAKKAVVTIEGETSKGTGFNIQKDGLIITNSHVVKNMNKIMIYFNNGKVFQGTIIKDSPEHDIAIVDIIGSNLPILHLQKNPIWKENDHIYIIGNPLSYTQIANEGNIEGTVYTDDKEKPVIQISAPVFRGNSGSPALSENNEVIGVVYATTVPKLKDGEKASGLVIPIEEVMNLLEDTK
ncbi:MAG TPA: serine protease [Pseudoneobacillus sp.]|nr:serine protease [Pseudoneobacillus sp.]